VCKKIGGRSQGEKALEEGKIERNEKKGRRVKIKTRSQKKKRGPEHGKIPKN